MLSYPWITNLLYIFVSLLKLMVWAWSTETRNPPCLFPLFLHPHQIDPQILCLSKLPIISILIARMFIKANIISHKNFSYLFTKFLDTIILYQLWIFQYFPRVFMIKSTRHDYKIKHSQTLSYQRRLPCTLSDFLQWLSSLYSKTQSQPIPLLFLLPRRQAPQLCVWWSLDMLLCSPFVHITSYHHFNLYIHLLFSSKSLLWFFYFIYKTFHCEHCQSITYSVF